MNERRKTTRLEIEVEVSLETDSNFYAGLTQDVSTSGVFVATSQVYPIGYCLAVHIALPGRPQPLIIEGEVRWIREASAIRREDGGPGMGIGFVNLHPDAAACISEFIATRDSLLYVDT